MIKFNFGKKRQKKPEKSKGWNDLAHSIEGYQRFFGSSITKNKYFKSVKRVTIFIFGIVILIVGIAMIVLPGPALVFIPLGLVILASEFLWAKWLLGKWKWGVGKVKSKVGRRIKKSVGA